MKKDVNARVFISCGQQKDSDEVDLAQKIARLLEEMGFEPYVAVAEQTLKGIKENIFRNLSESEYIIFIDFKRERLYIQGNGAFEDSHKYRGSLFSNQELALATFLDIEPLCFREKEVRKDDGILKYIQANSFEFSERDLLPDMVAEKVRERGWNAKWRNELILTREADQFQDIPTRPDGRMGRYFHIEVKNLHCRKLAYNCFAYLETLTNLSSVYVVSESGTKWAFEVTNTLEATTLLPGGSIIVLSYL